MSLQSRMAALISAIGADIKSIRAEALAQAYAIDDVYSTVDNLEAFSEYLTDWVTVKGGIEAYQNSGASGTVIYGTGGSQAFQWQVTPAEDCYLDAELYMALIHKVDAVYNFCYPALEISPAPGVGGSQPTLYHGIAQSQHNSVQKYMGGRVVAPSDILLLKNVTYTLKYTILKDGGSFEYYQAPTRLWHKWRLRRKVSGTVRLSVPDLDPETISVLPATPQVGQRVLFQSPSMFAQGIPPWLLRYAGGIGNAYPWDVISGEPFVDEVGMGGIEGGANVPGGYTHWVTNPQTWQSGGASGTPGLDLPLPGVYDVTVAGLLACATNYALASYTINGGAPDVDDAAWQGDSGGYWQSSSKTRKKVLPAVAGEPPWIEWRQRTFSSSAANYAADKQLKARPIRLAAI